jgi:hypothetical protein
MKESAGTLASEKNIREDLLGFLSKSGKADAFAGSAVIDEVLRVLEMIRHFQGRAMRRESSATASVRDVLHLVLRAMHYEFPMRNITVSKFIPPDLRPIPIRREHLETIFFQLLYRARQTLGASGGMIVVKVREKDYLSADNRHKKTFVLEVSGFPGDSNEDSPAAEDPAALALVTSLVENYGGNCRTARSARGTAVVVEIPA